MSSNVEVNDVLTASCVATGDITDGFAVCCHSSEFDST